MEFVSNRVVRNTIWVDAIVKIKLESSTVRFSDRE